MIDRPSDRTAAAQALVESLGGTLSFYWMQGGHDGFLIATFTDAVTASALATATSATGALAGVETHQIFDAAEQAEMVEHARTALAAYRPPTV